MNKAGPKHRPRVFSLRWFLATSGLLIITLVFYSLTRAVGQAREAARRSQCKGRFKQIELALHNYHDMYQCFPPAVTSGPDGRPWHSWRVLILPLLEQKSLYDRYRFDEPWDGPSNRKLAKEFPSLPLYRCPSEGTGESCSFFAVTGQGTLWPSRQPLSLNPQDAPDGWSNTLRVVEVADSGVHWMEPRDLLFHRMTFELNAGRGIGIRSRHPVGANVSFGDGQVRTLPADTPSETVKSMLLRDDGGPRGVP